MGGWIIPSGGAAWSLALTGSGTFIFPANAAPGTVSWSVADTSRTAAGSTLYIDIAGTYYVSQSCTALASGSFAVPPGQGGLTLTVLWTVGCLGVGAAALSVTGSGG